MSPEFRERMKGLKLVHDNHWMVENSRKNNGPVRFEPKRYEYPLGEFNASDALHKADDKYASIPPLARNTSGSLPEVSVPDSPTSSKKSPTTSSASSATCWVRATTSSFASTTNLEPSSCGTSE